MASRSILNATGHDLFTSIESFEGAAFNDTFIGTAASENFIGGAGADVINGGAGRDSAWYISSNAGNLDYGVMLSNWYAGSNTIESFQANNGDTFTIT
ncbi:Ca2+-binding RTX toxin-like protein [Pseudomonas sp. TE6288]|uniref:hypothetical protein n=1 Tax=Pseudomonas hunanensis TaxID=1247546 RepID=UPI002407648E|nr:hypothetical protein [Pseudomonas hunanensis]MDF9758007.1 Ca2+-binding RTX toxin-like protein [Pseudomonas hunanensis]